MEIPNGPESMTAEWLTQALRQNGTILGANVVSFQTKAIGAEGEGISGQMARVNLTYDLEELAAPHSLIAKFHALDMQVRTVVNSLGMYENEFRFYKHVAGRTGLPTARCYYGDYQDSGTAVFLLEDLAPARSVGWEMNSSQVELVVGQIARFHAFWWEHPELGEILRTQDPIALQKLSEMLQQQTQEKWEPILGLVQDVLPAPMVQIGKQIVDHWAAIGEQLRYQPPQTLIHGDFHGDNLLFAASEVGAPFSIVDWQLFMQGRGTYDIGMLVGGLPTEQRRSCEMDLVRMYHQTLLEHGVEGYSFEQCLDDYRLAQLDCFARLIFVLREPFPGEDLDRYYATTRKFRDVELPRRCAAILDLGADRLIMD
jgi:hypothetical protein